jgi:hypothetical protein
MLIVVMRGRVPFPHQYHLLVHFLLFIVNLIGCLQLLHFLVLLHKIPLYAHTHGLI